MNPFGGIIERKIKNFNRMEKEFTDWYKKEQARFHSGQFDEKQIAYAAWLEGKKQVMPIADVSKSCPHTTEICKERLGEQPVVEYSAPYGSKHAAALMWQVDNVSRKYGYFYRHIC